MYSYMSALFIVYIVSTVLIGLAAVSALVLTIRLYSHTPGSNDVNSLRFVKFVKLAFWLFTLGNVLSIAVRGLYAELTSMAYEGYSSKYLAGWVLQSVSIPFVHVGAASVFLSLFYLTRVLARPPSDETSRGLREGQKWAIGAFVWVCLASITSMGLSISLWAPRAVGLDYFTSSYAARSLASFVFDIALYVTDLICAISVLVYIVKARKKLLGTPLQKASNNLLACGILWLIHVVWLVLFILLTNLAYYAYTGEPLGCFLIILDVLLDIYLTFVVLVLLYVLVAKDKYAVWQPQEQEQKQEQPVV